MTQPMHFPEEIDIYELLDKEFKIVLKKLSELKRNQLNELRKTTK